MRFLFVGLGSIGRRHVRNLRSLRPDAVIDALRRPGSVPAGTDVPVDHEYLGLDGLSGYDAVFVTNPTDAHLGTLRSVLPLSRHFFVEKPFVSVRDLSEAADLSLPPGTTCYVACPLRRTRLVGHLKAHVGEWRVVGVRCICSSHLPDWRPGQDYRLTYSARADMGGGVATDLVHEWDYLQHLFGYPEDVVFRKGRKSSLEIDCEDTALYIAEYPDKFVEVHLDYFGRVPVRELTLFTDEETIRCDLLRGEIVFMRRGETVSLPDGRDEIHAREMEHFLDMVEGRADNDNPPETALRTIWLTQGRA